MHCLQCGGTPPQLGTRPPSKFKHLSQFIANNVFNVKEKSKLEGWMQAKTLLESKSNKPLSAW